MSNAAGGVPPLHVQIQITTTGARAAANAMRQVGGATGSMTRGLQQGIISTRTLGDAMRMSASLLKYTVAGAFINIGKQAIQMQRQFELSFSRIKGLVVVGTGNIEMMKKSVLEMATETTRGPLELADALYYIASAGIKDATKALDVLRTSAKAAAAGLGTTNTVADALTSTLNAYGNENYSAARAGDILVATVREGKAEADTFAPALGKVLPVAAAFGASFEDVSAAIAALSRGGLSAGTAAIYVRQTLSQLLKPSKQAQEVLQSVGTSAEEIRKNVQEQGLFQALITLRDQLGGIENAADFTKVFGNVRALTAVLSLVGPAAEENRGVFERMNNSIGDLDYAFNQYTNTLDARFNKALAAQQTALIEIGKTLQPLVVGFLELTARLMGMFQTIASNPVGKFFITFGAGAAIAVAVLATVLKTSSALIRLFSNMSITIAGNTVMWNAQTRQLLIYDAAARRAAATAQVNTMVANGWTVANTGVAASFGRIAVAATFAMRALGWIALVASAFAALAPLLMKNKKGSDSLTDSFGKLETVMDSAVKTAKSGIVIDVSVNYQDNALELAKERMGEEISKQTPELAGQLANIEKMGQEVARRYGKALMTTLFSDRSETDQKVILAYLADKLNVNPEQIATSLIPAETENAVTDALSYLALVAASEAKTLNEEIFGNVDPGAGLEGFGKQFADIANKPGYYGQFAAIAGDTAKVFGESFTKGINDTREIAPLLLTLEKIRSGMQLAGASAAQQGEAIQMILGPALQGLTGDLDIAGDKVGNLADIIMREENAGAIKEMLEATLGTEDSVKIEAVYKRMQDALDGINTDTAEGAALATQKIANLFLQLRVEAETTGGSIENVAGQIDDIAGKFESGLSPAVQTSVDAFDAANAAIKEYERGQRAVMGLALTQVEATVDFRDSLRDLAEASNDAGGNLLGTGEKSDKAKTALIGAGESLLSVVNAIAASGDMEAAASAFSSGMAEIYAAASSQGIPAGDVSQFLETIGLTPDMMMETLKNQGEAMGEAGSEVGLAVSNGVARGIASGTPVIQQAVGSASNVVITAFRAYFDIKSPSRVMEEEIGLPLAEGVVQGFSTGVKSGKSTSMMAKALDRSIMSAFKKGGRQGLSKYLSDFLKKKESVETPAQDFVKETISRMKDIIGSLGNYIKSQLNFRQAKADLVKLVNLQRGLEDRRRKAAREQQYSETRFGRGGGAEVTGYEQAQLDQLQLEFERVSRDYAMGRATYTELVDAEIALYEARNAASEINDDVLNAQNRFLDATVDVENQQLELAGATVEVLEAYQDVQEASIELYYNHSELAKVYDTLAEATGIASGKLVVGKTDITNLGGSVETLGGYVSTVGGYVSTMGNAMTITGNSFRTNFEGENGVFAKIRKVGTNVDTMTKSIGASFTDMSKGLVDPDSQFMKDLKSLGAGVWQAIQTGAQEKLDQSPLNFRISVNAVIDGNGNGTMTFKTTFDPNVQTPGVPTGRQDVAGRTGFGYTGIDRTTAYGPRSTSMIPGMAVGGPVTKGSPYLIGERGPELFLPKVSGTIVTNSALDRYTRVSQRGTNNTTGAPGNNIVVTVNNPVPEPAAESITRRMRVLANSGLFG